jgi:AhpD family alkylhydroperoxidase
MPEFSSRIDFARFNQIAPAVRPALHALGNAAVEAGIEKELLELIKLRASQLNGCAFCLRLHLNLARPLGIAQEKLDLLTAWRDTPDFSRRERAALRWTELLTEIAHEHVADADYAAAREEFSEQELVFLSAAIAAINSWNRLAVAFRFTPPARS